MGSEIHHNQFSPAVASDKFKAPIASMCHFWGGC